MNFLTKHQPDLSVTALAAILLVSLSAASLSHGQLVNGVFDPSKVMVAKDKVKQLEAIEKRIAAANQYNKTLGTPSHPKPEILTRPPEVDMNTAPGKPPRYGPEPVASVPTFDLPPDVERRNRERAQKRRNREKPTVVANKLPPAPPQPDLPPPPPPEEPIASANPVSIRGMVPAFEAPAPEPAPAVGNGSGENALDPEIDFANAPEAEPRGFFGRLLRSRQTSVDDIDMTTPELGPSDLPPSDSDVSMNGEVPGSELASMQESDGELVPLDGDGPLTLPANSSGPDFDLPSRGEAQRSSGFLSMFSKSRGSRTFDVPDRPVPISIGSGNRGNPYSSDSFKADSGYSPLFDEQQDPGAIRDMTQPGVLPFSSEIAKRHSRKPITDVSQYLIVSKDETLFVPFKHGSEEPDKDNAFDLYAGATVKDLGISGLKRMVQVDSGEAGMIEKFAARRLSVSEEVVMSNGLAKGHPWYSIIDTEAEYDEFAANLSSRPMQDDPKPQRPWGPARTLSNGKPDSDLSQYFVIKKTGVTFGPFAANTQEIDLASSFEIPAGAIVKKIETTGSNVIIETDSGENGVVPVDGLRPINSSEQTSLAKGIVDGRPWYSILDTTPDAVPFSAARPPSPPIMSSNQQPTAPAAAPKVVASKPESDVSQYYLVKKDGAMFEPFMYGTRNVDTDSSFEMYESAVVKVISTTDGKHVIQTDSGENGVMAVSDLRPLSSSEQDRMKSGISAGNPWYSILDTAAAE